MANLTHLFKIGENVKYVVNDFDEKRIYYINYFYSCLHCRR